MNVLQLKQIDFLSHGCRLFLGIWPMIVYSNWKNLLQTKVHSGLLVSKEFCQVEYSIVGPEINYTEINGNNMVTFIHFQLIS